jgi:hypothetical protein
MDLKNFYLNTLLDRSENVCIKLADIPQEFIDNYKLNKFACDSWVYFEMHHGMYGLPLAGILANCEDSYTESLCCDSAFAHKKEFSIFKFPERFSEISWTESSLY